MDERVSAGTDVKAKPGKHDEPAEPDPAPDRVPVQAPRTGPPWAYEGTVA